MKYDQKTRKMTLDNFIVASVQIKRLTDSFRRYHLTRISELYEDCVFVCNEIWIYLSCVFQSRPGDERNCDSCIRRFHGIGHGSPQLETRPEAIHSISGAESLLDETFLVDLQQLGSAQHSANSNKLTWNTMKSFSHSWKWTLFLVIVKSLKFVLCDTPKNTILMHLMRLVWLQTNVRFKCLNWKVFFLSLYLPLDIYSTTLLTRTWQPCCLTPMIGIQTFNLVMFRVS